MNAPTSISGEALIFLHIPKTAGTTFNRVLEAQYPVARTFTVNGHFAEASVARFKALPEERRAQFRLVKGHFAFGLHEWLPQPATYITILRDPVDRVVSTYYYVLANRLHPLRREVLGKKMSLEDFVRAYPWKANTQTKFLAGLGKRDLCPPQTLEHALANLESRVQVAGLFERLEDTLRLLSVFFDWKDVVFSRHRRGRARPQKLALAASTVELIRETNALDMELYRRGEERFAAQFAAHRTAAEAVPLRDARTAGTLARWCYESGAIARAALAQIRSIL